MIKKKRIIRFKTREVKIGDVPLGGVYPIRIQSMTTTNTMDTNATVEQIIRIIDAGADYVRIATPSIKEAENLKVIKNKLKESGYNTPLIADIHFTPNAAEIAARIVEKVRINPGNYADKKKFEVKEYTDSQYNEELERIRQKFIPLVMICKEYGTAMRIGVNHGSLSDRIMNRFGDTPLGMVESALEFVRICEDVGYYNIVLSMKASIPSVMIDSYRLLVEKMADLNMNYPIHLGVTEAGDGLDGRVKSSIGIGTLLEEGIGDTIRISLTEEPENEIIVCKILLDRYDFITENTDRIKIKREPEKEKTTTNISIKGDKKIPVVILSVTEKEYYYDETCLRKVGYFYCSNDPMLDSFKKETDKDNSDSPLLDRQQWKTIGTPPDYLFLGSRKMDFSLPADLKVIYNFNFWKNLPNKDDSIPLLSLKEYELNYNSIKNIQKFVNITAKEYSENYNELFTEDYESVIVVSFSENEVLENKKYFISRIKKAGVKNNIIIRIGYGDINVDNFTVYSAIDTGELFINNYISGIWLDYKDIEIANNVSFSILQSTRRRFSKTDFISCPSCGRTQFNLQETTAKIKEAIGHLKGLKIAIMGCIVNGPGEMADADYGYVGSGPNRVTLYKGKEIIKRNIDSKYALDELIKLIKENGDWIDK